MTGKQSSPKGQPQPQIYAVLVRVLDTFKGGQLLQLPVPGQAEAGRALAPLLLHQLGASRVLDLVELGGRGCAVAVALAVALLQ